MDSSKLRQDKHTDHGLYLYLPDTGAGQVWSISSPVITTDSITGSFMRITGPKATELLFGWRNLDLRPNKRSVILYARTDNGIRPAEGSALGFPRSSIERVERIKGNTGTMVGLGLMILLPFAVLGAMWESSYSVI